MEAGTIISSTVPFSGAIYALSAKPRRDWVSNNEDFVRSLPICVGGVIMLPVLFNRTVLPASSSQCRADLLTLGLAVTNKLTGLAVNPAKIYRCGKSSRCRVSDHIFSTHQHCNF
ncbi:hypothetical protein HS088_TW06G00828 [Tripterygium wilfordii]|uniref:Uncharacterized protein n=1 Tax=Tripterygium wilfordii TaxID=458696 RepID=A0A7J7DK00_TRIWF|nr:hypothetical protein HS088_TW06G00828 [Tripterygium wilfordii]